MPETNAQEAQKEAPARPATPAPGRSPTGQKSYRLWLDPWVLGAAALIALIPAIIGVVFLIGELSDGGNSIHADVTILTPKDGETVTGPVVLTVESAPKWRIADPAEGIAGAAHFHAWVDIHPFTPSGEVIPKQPGIYHFSEDTLTLDLTPGSHLVILGLGDNDDVRIPGATVASITITVK